MVLNSVVMLTFAKFKFVYPTDVALLQPTMSLVFILLSHALN